MGCTGHLIIPSKEQKTHKYIKNREAAASAMGNMMEAFISPQPPVQPREFEHMNRTFTTKVRLDGYVLLFNSSCNLLACRSHTRSKQSLLV